MDTLLGDNGVGLSSIAFAIGNALRRATWKALSHMEEMCQAKQGQRESSRR